MLSHWDHLPLEIQTYILDLKLRQERLDMVTDRQKELCEMIRLYYRVKYKWNLGHVRCQPFQCYVCNGMRWRYEKVTPDTIFHEKVYGSYKGREVLLGNCLERTMEFVDDVKENITIFFLRMDLKTKMELSEQIESYWDLLPWHIASRIVNLKNRQKHLDEVQKEKRKKLCEEIEKFHTLKMKWEMGSIVCKPLLIPCQHGCRKWYGKYVDVSGQQKRAFLAFELDMAIERCSHVKSFIYHS